jgi:hypothetical protein
VDASPLLLTTPAAAKLLAVSPATLSTLRSRSNAGPPFIRLGRSVRYPLELLTIWAQEHRVMTSTSDEAGPLVSAA